ncbi:MAG TPA: hypothetical protein VGK74_19140 [Symbiobacteriaceae bacterium]
MLKYLVATGRHITTELEYGKLPMFHVDQKVPLDEVLHHAEDLDVSYDFLAPGACDGLGCFEHHQKIRWPSGELPAMPCIHLLPILNCLLENGNRIDGVMDEEGLRIWRTWWCVDTAALRQQVAIPEGLQFYDDPGDRPARYAPQQGFICNEHHHKIVWQVWEPPESKDTRP